MSRSRSLSRPLSCQARLKTRGIARTALAAALLLPHTVPAQSACTAGGNAGPVLEECPLWELPDENRAGCRRFMAEGEASPGAANGAPASTAPHTSCGDRAAGQEKVACGELLIPRYGPTAASDGRWVYVYGGAPNGSRNGPDFRQQGLHSSIERVDPVSLKSEYFSNGLYRRANHATVFSDSSLISCGGRTQVGLTRRKLRSCEFLDLRTGIFRELPPLPEAVRTLGMAEAGGHLYVVGGLRDGSRYSPGTFKLAEDRSAWERMADAPLALSGQIVSVRQKLYALGGYDGTAMSSVMVFDTETAQWERGKDLPYPLSAYSAVTDGAAIYLFGDYRRMTVVHRYEPEAGDLYLLDLQITPRRHSAAVVIDGRVLVIGGNQASVGMSLTLIEAFDLEALRTGGRLVSVPPAESRR